MNFLEETVEMIVSECVTRENLPVLIERAGELVDFIRLRGERVTWEQFVSVADFDYDYGFGGAEIDGSLVIVLRDGSWLDQREYGGPEWWERHYPPKRPETAWRTLVRLDLLGKCSPTKLFRR